MKRLTCLVGALAAVTACGGPVPVVTELGTAATPRSGGYAAAIHDNGRIVGAYGEPQQAAEFRADGSVVLLPIPTGYDFCVAAGIADDGTIAGNCSLPDLNTHIFTWDSAGVAHQLRDLPPGVYNSMGEMNRHGVILEQESGGPDAGYWTHDLRSGKRTKIPFDGAVFGRALGINDAGEIVGFISSGTQGESWPVKWSGDPLVATVLATPDGCVGRVGGTAFDINNRGVIVGTVCIPANEIVNMFDKPVVWSSASAVPGDLPTPRALPGVTLMDVTVHDINDDGIAIGVAGQYAGDLVIAIGLAWTADGGLVELDSLGPSAINAAGVIVGSGGTYPRQPVRIELVGAK